MIHSAPDAVKDTYLKMKSEQGKKLEGNRGKLLPVCCKGHMGQKEKEACEEDRTPGFH